MQQNHARQSDVVDGWKYSALQAPVSWAEITAYREQFGRTGLGSRDILPSLGRRAAILLAWTPAVALGVFLGYDAGGVVGLMIAALLFICVVGVLLHQTFKQYRSTWARAVRLSNFAADNGWEYKREPHDCMRPSGIFEYKNRIEYETIVAENFEASVASFIHPDDSKKQPVYYSFITIPLGRDFPNMVLDGRHNNLKLFGVEITNLPVAFKNNQVLSLEGDFDTYFTLYAPKEYKTDALYIFTPDLMALLIDHAASFDIEIVDNQFVLYPYSPDGLAVMEDAEMWRKIEKIRDLIMKKMHRVAKNYKDTRILEGAAPTSVADGGRRLTTTISAITIVVIILYIALSLLKNVLS